MKHVLALAALLVMTFTAVAQPPQGQRTRGRDLPPEALNFEQKDPAQLAKEQTDQLDKLVALTPKQYRKIYRFNRKQAKEQPLEQRMKKYRKVLTPEQFQKWETIETQREFRRILEKPE